MAMSAYDRKIIKFKCTHCGAASGHPCVTKNGKRCTEGFHILRKAKVFPDMGKPGRGKPIPKYDDDE